MNKTLAIITVIGFTTVACSTTTTIPNSSGLYRDKNAPYVSPPAIVSIDPVVYEYPPLVYVEYNF